MTARGARGLAAPAAAGLLAVLVLAPLVPLALLSFGRGWFFPDLLPEFRLEAYRYAFSDVSGFVPAIGQSFAVALPATALAVAIAVPAARVLGRVAFPGRAAVELLILAPALVPPIAVAMGLHALFIKAGLAGTLAGVVLVHLVPILPYAVFVIAAAVARSDPGLEEQARLLGASPLRTWTTVILPTMVPALAVAAALSFLVSWSQVALTMLVGGGRVVTVTALLAQFAAAGRMDLAGVAAVFSTLPALAALLVLGRRIAAARPPGGSAP